jgi:hypothetical protein
MRIVWVILVIIVLSVSVYSGIYYFQRAAAAGYNLDNERYSRMLAEENLLKASRKLDALESEIRKLKKTAETKDQILVQMDTVNADLRKQLDRLAVTQQDMERKLKSVMAAPAATSEQPVTSETGHM